MTDVMPGESDEPGVADCPSAHAAAGGELVFCSRPDGHEGRHEAMTDDDQLIVWDHNEPAG